MGQPPHDTDAGRVYGASMTLRSRLFAATYDRQIARVERAGLAARRAELVGRAAGRVLEIGAGTGLNLPYYGADVTALTLTEPELPMLRRLQRRVANLGSERRAMVLRAPSEDLPFDDAVFDVAVSTLVLCGVSDQPRALRELRRVLRPNGTLLFLEHVRAEDATLSRRQDRMNGCNRFIVGCECNRPTLASIRAAGFDVTHVEHTITAKVPKWVRPTIVGSARAVPRDRTAVATDNSHSTFEH